MELYDEIRAFGSKLGTEDAMAGIRDFIARTERSASPHKDRAVVPLTRGGDCHRSGIVADLGGLVAIAAKAMEG